MFRLITLVSIEEDDVEDDDEDEVDEGNNDERVAL